MSFLDAREHGSKPGSGGAVSAQNEVHARLHRPPPRRSLLGPRPLLVLAIFRLSSGR